MDMKACVSSNISAYGYDSDTATLQVEFTSGSVYAYNGVPKDIYDGLDAAESKGKYFNLNIKNAFAFERIK